MSVPCPIRAWLVFDSCLGSYLDIGLASRLIALGFVSGSVDWCVASVCLLLC